jgi:transposase
VRVSSVLRRLLGIEQAVIERVELGSCGLITHMRVGARQRLRCSRCRKRCGKHDNGQGRRRWRALDMGSTRSFIEADAPRVRCAEHGVVVAHVPWASPGSGFTHEFEQQTAYLAVNASQKVVAELMRIAWRTVGRILQRVVSVALAGRDLLDGVSRIGIDETSYRRGHRYLTVVVCHDTGRLIWASPGCNQATLNQFFDELGVDRCARITHVSADGAAWIHRAVRSRCPNVTVCMDAFHLVKWVNEALDKIRRVFWNDTRRHRKPGRRPKDLNARARRIKHSRWALLKNPENLTTSQAATLAELEAAGGPLWKAWLLKEDLRELLKLDADDASARLDLWLERVDEASLDEFTRIAATIRDLRPEIEAMLTHRLTNGRVESVNAKIRLIQARAFGFHNPYALIALAKLTLSGLCPPLPGRAVA